MAEELQLPDEMFGFGAWLLWLVATRATPLVDLLFASWVGLLGEICGLTEPEAELLANGRGYGPFAVEPAALREAIGRTFRTGRQRGRPAAATATLPRDLASFTGRAVELEWLRATGVDRDAAPGIAPVVLISGMAGAGKTNLRNPQTQPRSRRFDAMTARYLGHPDPAGRLPPP